MVHVPALRYGCHRGGRYDPDEEVAYDKLVRTTVEEPLVEACSFPNRVEV